MTTYNSLLDFLAEEERRQVFREPEERKRRISKRAQILQRLLQGPAYNYELSRITWKFRARISELRQAGCEIEAERIEGGVWRYTLLNPDHARLLLEELLEKLEGENDD